MTATRLGRSVPHVLTLCAAVRCRWSLKVESADGPVRAELVETPILRYSTPQRLEFDQSLWVWGRVGRPMAIATIGPNGCEVVSVADGPVSMTAKSGWKWNPSGSGMKWTPVPDAPAVGKTAVERGRQMKDIARRFTANASSKVKFVELRLMDQPLYRYADLDQRLIDGAIFSFAGGTNPEVLLLLECRQEERRGPLIWYYSCARMSAAMCEARIGGKIVWSCPGVGRWDATEPYFSRPFGDQDTVDGVDSTDVKEE